MNNGLIQLLGEVDDSVDRAREFQSKTARPELVIAAMQVEATLLLTLVIAAVGVPGIVESMELKKLAEDKNPGL